MNSEFRIQNSGICLCQSVIESTRPTPPVLFPRVWSWEFCTSEFRLWSRWEGGMKNTLWAAGWEIRWRFFTESWPIYSLSYLWCHAMRGFCFSTSQLSFSALGSLVNPLPGTVALQIAGLHSWAELRKELGLKKHLSRWHGMESLPRKFSKNVARTLGLQMKRFHNPLMICWMCCFSLPELKNGRHGYCGTGQTSSTAPSIKNVC